MTVSMGFNWCDLKARKAFVRMTEGNYLPISLELDGEVSSLFCQLHNNHQDF